MTQAPTLSQLAQWLDAPFTGDPNLVVNNVVHPAHAHTAHDMALILDPAVVAMLTQKPVQTALVPASLTLPEIPNQIQVARPKVALAKLLDIFDKPVHVDAGIHPSAVVSPQATVEEGVSIGPLCTVAPGAVIQSGTKLVAQVHVGAGAHVGQNCLFHPGVVVGDRVQIGHRVILQPGAVIGSDGYSFVTEEVGSVEAAKSSGKVSAQNDSTILRINSVGNVVIEDDVEIGANTCIDRATLGETRIKRGTKLDNLVQVAHNVTLGENCLIVSQVGIAGSCQIGNRVVLAGQAGLKDHITIGDDAIVLPQSGVTQNLEGKALYLGSPAMPRKEFLKKEMQIKRLSTYAAKLEALTKRLEVLEAALEEAAPKQEATV